jgi:valyl-tRNA synthetase
MAKEIPKTYAPKETEDRIYKLWEESGVFTPENLSRTDQGNFVATIAPPNITGELHMGHALELTLQDIVFRMKRMQGYKTLWLPGTDHAGIAAQNAVEKQLAKEGLTRHDLGREKFIERMWQWKEKYGNAILNQLKKLGLSVDWTRTRFTMDENYQKAVETAFLKYKEKGWIYQGERVINWCVRCATAISDLEVNYVPEKTKLYYIKYGPFTLATTRPETKLGDTALAVHPSDERYKKYVGHDLEIESVDNSAPLSELARTKKIKIKFVADHAVDPAFGTGIVKVTPAHDITDFEIAQRNDLPSIKIIDEHGRMNDNAGPRYSGLKVLAARDQIVKDLETIGLIEKIEDYDHNLARCDRCNSVIEPLPSRQWFLKMQELAQMAKQALQDKEVKIYPGKWTDQAIRWLDNIRDWNISRQLWWGHKIPIDGENDVLDTWFSSALWPFAVMGWPDVESGDYKNYYPIQFITSDRNILFLWQMRMIYSGKFFTGKAPFSDLYIHATVLTKDGRRMSKSLGTGVNPLELIDKYGADALRFALAYQTTALQDLKFGEEAVLMGKKFANKLWNIARYVLMKVGEKEIDLSQPPANQISTRVQNIAREITQNINDYKFGEAGHLIYDFVWHDLADKYIEETKTKEDQETKNTLLYVLATSLRLLHPFMPFITEEIYSNLPISNKKLLLVENWPTK